MTGSGVMERWRKSRNWESRKQKTGTGEHREPGFAPPASEQCALIRRMKAFSHRIPQNFTDEIPLGRSLPRFTW